MDLVGKRPTFRRNKNQLHPYRILILLLLLLGSIFLLQAVENGIIESPFAPTLIPTRTSSSYTLEGETRFQAGDLNGAIEAYGSATDLEPDNAQVWAEFARIQTYSSLMLITDSERSVRLKAAMDSANRAAELAPDDSTVHAIRAFVLDWYADPSLVGDEWQTMLGEAEQAAVRALTLDNQNILALAYYAEILVDQQHLIQAEQNINQALERDPDLMDVHRVNAYVRESLGYYGDAIRAYERAAQITPNLTFLYIRIGVNYRQLKQYDRALEYFARAADINKQIGIQDPLPYLAIGKTYSQMGEFFIAARNVEKVLELDPGNPNIYGTLGMIYFKSRNYEGAIPALKCATLGCTAEESCSVRFCDPETSPPIAIPASNLTANTVVYYYTYGSVLAGMHRPHNDYCTESLEILGMVRDEFENDPTIIPIVEASEDICESFGYTAR